MHIPGSGNNPHKRRIEAPQPTKPTHEMVEAYFGNDFVPAHDMVLLETIFIGEQGSIVIPDSARMKQETCRVVRVGEGRMTESGAIRKPCCKAGDYVFALVPKGIRFPAGDGRTLVIMNNSDILGIFPTPPPAIIESEKKSLEAALEAKKKREEEAAQESCPGEPPPVNGHDPEQPQA